MRLVWLRTGAIPDLRRRKDAMRLIPSPPALETQESVGIHSFQPVPPTTTPVSALERWSSTLLIPIPQLALQHCYSILPAQTTRPSELTRSSITLLARTTPP